MARVSGEIHEGALTPEQRAANVESYKRDMAPHFAAELLHARGELVKKYRARPQTFPDGIDTDYDRWYRAEEWTDAGRYLGSSGAGK